MSKIGEENRWLDEYEYDVGGGRGGGRMNEWMDEYEYGDTTLASLPTSQTIISL